MLRGLASGLPRKQLREDAEFVERLKSEVVLSVDLSVHLGLLPSGQSDAIKKPGVRPIPQGVDSDAPGLSQLYARRRPVGWSAPQPLFNRDAITIANTIAMVR